MSELNLRSADVLVQPVELCRSWDWHDPGPLFQQPRKRDLRRSGLLAVCEGLQPLYEREVCLPVLLRESRNDVAEVSSVERRLVVDLAGEKPLTERAERHESDAELLERRKNFCLGLSPPQGVFALQRRNRVNRVRPANGLNACLRQSEVSDLAFPDEVPDCAGDVFDRHVGIDAMLIEEVDPIGFEPL